MPKLEPIIRRSVPPVDAASVTFGSANAAELIIGSAMVVIGMEFDCAAGTSKGTNTGTCTLKFDL